MSNFVYGYIRTSIPDPNLFNNVEQLSLGYGLGIKKIGVDELHGFPDNLTPLKDPNNIHCIEILCGPGKDTAGYLIDFDDWAEDAEIELPRNGLGRLKILLSLIKDILNLSQVKEIHITMNDSGEIESIKEIDLVSFEKQVIHDFNMYAPPNILYILRKGEK